MLINYLINNNSINVLDICSSRKVVLHVDRWFNFGLLRHFQKNVGLQKGV